MGPTEEWNEIRDGLRARDLNELHRAVVRVGKIKAECLPADIGDAVIELFRHADPDVRAEAVRAVGLHWRLEIAVRPISELLQRDEDWRVQISSISALGALGLDHKPSICLVSRSLASVVRSERFAENERMIAYLELLRVQGKITPKQYMAKDKHLPEQLRDFEIDGAWIEDVAGRDGPEPGQP